MKFIKRLFTVLLSALMTCGLSITAFAAESYTIKIDNAVKGQTYSAYKIFDATHVETDDTKVAYTISTDSEWYQIMVDYTQPVVVEGETPVYAAYNPFTFTPSAADPDTMVVGLAVKPDDEIAAVPDYAVDAGLLAQYLNTKLHEAGASFTAAASATSDGTSVTLNVSEAGEGYYFVDTTLGALCSLDTVTGTAIEIMEKNTEPTLNKTVEEDSTGVYGETADADMSQKVNFRLTVVTGTNSTELDADFVITDTLPAGMTYVADSLIVYEETDGTHWTDGYSVDYTNDVLTIILEEEKVEAQGASASILIEYKATVDQDAVVNGVGNTNTAVLEYHRYTTVETSATVFTYKIGDGFKKEDGTDQTALEGVEFILSKTDDAGTTYYAELNGDAANGYKLAGWKTDEADATAIVTNDQGGFKVEGVDADTYILTETKALDGYNLLTDTITIVVDEDGGVTYKMTSDNTAAGAASITVENNTGVELPSTGGIGTTIFYVVGSILVIGAAVLLIVKKRMSNME